MSLIPVQTIPRGNALPFGAFVPHPPILLPEIGGAESDQVKTTFEGCAQIAATLKTMECETLVMTSPHMAGISSTPGVFHGPSFSGNLAHFGAPQLRFEFDNDSLLAEAISRSFSNEGMELRTLNATDGSAAMALDHGLSVFLYFLNKIGYKPQVCLITPAFSLPEDNFRHGVLVSISATG
jgi:aromatic ring-opening dioxygenase LigB subunit